MRTPTITVFPVEGRKLPMPELGNAPVPEGGAAVPLTSYYVHALRVGDITDVDPSAPPVAEVHEASAASTPVVAKVKWPKHIAGAPAE